MVQSMKDSFVAVSKGRGRGHINVQKGQAMVKNIVGLVSAIMLLATMIPILCLSSLFAICALLTLSDCSFPLQPIELL